MGRVGGGHREGVQPQLDLLQRVEGAVDHRLEHGVDDISSAALARQIRVERGGQGEPFLVKGQQVVAGDQDVDLERVQAVGGLAGRRMRPDIAAEREDDGLPIGLKRPRGGAVAEFPKCAHRALGNRQRGGHVIEARPVERDVEPEEATLRAQCGDPLSRGVVEPVEDLCHGDLRPGRR